VIYYNENGASQEDKVFEVGFYKTTSTNIQTGEQKKLWSFSRIVTKREWDLEDPVDAVSGGRGFRGTFPLSQPDTAIIVFRLSQKSIYFLIKTPNFITNDKLCVL